MKGIGTIHGIVVHVRGQRPLKRPPNAPTVHDFEPKIFWSTFSGATPPALHVFPGDTIRTKTVDAYGHDEHDVPRVLPAANPQTGPFYIDSQTVWEAGWYEGFAIGASDATVGKKWCLRSATSHDAIVAIVAKYVREHPEIWSDSADSLVTKALASVYSCVR